MAGGAVRGFAGHRVSGYYRWERYADGVLTRSFAWADSETSETSKLTTKELALGFHVFPQSEAGCENDGARLPDEGDVLDIAAAWGFDPESKRAATRLRRDGFYK